MGILAAAYLILSSILSAVIKVPRSYSVWGISVGYGSYTPVWLSTIIWLVQCAIAVLAVLGIINAVTGKLKEVPLIGKLLVILK